MTASITPAKATPRRLSRLRVDEISLCRQPANKFAVALLAKSSDFAEQQRDLRQRLDALEARRAMEAAPARLMKALAQRGAELQAAARGERYIAPIEDIALSKEAGGGQRLMAAAVQIAKRHRDAQVVQRDQRHTAEQRTAKTETPAERLVAAARARSAVVKRAG